MSTISIHAGDYEVIGQGTVFSKPGDPVKIEFGDGNEKLALVLDLQLDAKDGGKFIAELLNPKTMKITFMTDDKEFDGGNVEPIELGELRNRKLYCNIAVEKLVAAPRAIYRFNLLLKNK